MQIVQARGREIPVVTRHKRYTPERARAEALFVKPVQTTKPRVLEDAPKMSIKAPAKSIAVDEIEHQKVFRLVSERRFEDAARIAARLINGGREEGFYIVDGADLTKATAWHKGWVTDKTVRANVHYITPARAQVLLMNNLSNRNVKAANLAKIMRDIADGRFVLNGETLIIADDGTVNDGQHRCFSILLTGIQVESLVASGLTKQSMRTIDIGIKREAKDRLAIAGVSNYVVLSALSSLAFELTNNRKPTPSESEDFYFDNADGFQLALSACGTGFKGIGQAPMAAASFYLLRNGEDVDVIRTFFASVRTGEMLTKRDPRMVLRRAIFEDGKKVKLPREKWVSAFVAHFEKYKQRRSMTDLVFDVPLNWN